MRASLQAAFWALLQDVWWGDERSRIIAETVETFGEQLADRLEAAEPPEHQTLCRRLANSPYTGMAAFSCWVVGDVENPVIWTWALPPSRENVVYVSMT